MVFYEILSENRVHDSKRKLMKATEVLTLGSSLRGGPCLSCMGSCRSSGEPRVKKLLGKSDVSFSTQSTLLLLNLHRMHLI